MQIAGYAARLRSSEVQIKDCLFCGNTRWNLELSAYKGVYSCWVCRASGSLNRLFDRIGIQAHVHVNLERTDDEISFAEKKTYASASTDPTAVAYLARRGFNRTHIMQYGLQVCLDRTDNMYGRIVIPLYEYWQGTYVGELGRAYFDDSVVKYMSQIPKQVIVGWKNADPVHVLVEGAFDAMKVNLAGWNAAAMLGSGGDSMLMKWASHVGMTRGSVLLMLDSDAADKARKMKSLISQVVSDVRIVELPDNCDPADLDIPEISNILQCCNA